MLSARFARVLVGSECVFLHQSLKFALALSSVELGEQGRFTSHLTE